MLRTIRPLILSTLIWFCVAIGCANRDDADRNERLRIEVVLRLQETAWNKGDLDGFMAGYWDSPELEFVSGTTTTKGFQLTKDRYFKRYKAEGQEMGTLAFRDLQIMLTGPTEATVTGRWKLTMAKQSPAGGFTLIFRKFDDGWKIIKDVTTSDDPPKKE